MESPSADGRIEVSQHVVPVCEEIVDHEMSQHVVPVCEEIVDDEVPQHVVPVCEELVDAEVAATCKEGAEDEARASAARDALAELFGPIDNSVMSILEDRSSMKHMAEDANAPQKTLVVLDRGHKQRTSEKARATRSQVRAKKFANMQAASWCCSVCGGDEATEGNDLALCDGCDQGFHQACHDPVVESFGEQDDKWFCAQCTLLLSRDRGLRFNVGDFIWANVGGSRSRTAKSQGWWPAVVLQIKFTSHDDSKPYWVSFFSPEGVGKSSWVGDCHVKPWSEMDPSVMTSEVCAAVKFACIAGAPECKTCHRECRSTQISSSNCNVTVACHGPATASRSRFFCTPLPQNTVKSQDPCWICSVCGGDEAIEGNDVLLCDGCDKGFHQACHDPVVENFGRPEDDKWFCSDCTLVLSRTRDLQLKPGDFAWAKMKLSQDWWPAVVLRVEFTSKDDPEPYCIKFFTSEGIGDESWLGDHHVKPWSFIDSGSVKNRHICAAVKFAHVAGALVGTNHAFAFSMSPKTPQRQVNVTSSPSAITTPLMMESDSEESCMETPTEKVRMTKRQRVLYAQKQNQHQARTPRNVSEGSPLSQEVLEIRKLLDEVVVRQAQLQKYVPHAVA